MSGVQLYGVLAEFDSEAALVAAARHARAHGYTQAEAFAPFPVEGLPDVLGMPPDWTALATLAGGIFGGAAGYFLQWYSAVVDYPINVGGRPLHSWPTFIPIAFEMVVLGAALAAFIAMLVQNGLPRLYHPLFEVDEFESATRNRFFLCLPARDPVFAPGPASALLGELGPLLLREVPA